MLSRITVLAVVMFFCSSVPVARADTITIDFDSLNASAGPVSGAPLASYLAGYGVTLSNSTLAGATLEVRDAASIWWLQAASAPNFFWHAGPAGANHNQPFSYQVRFANPLDSFTFTRIAYQALASPWDARALDSSGNTLGQVGENWQGNSSARTFTLLGPGITAVVFERTIVNTVGGLNNPPTDNWILEAPPIPEPSSWIVFTVVAMCVFWCAPALIGRRGKTADFAPSH